VEGTVVHDRDAVEVRRPSLAHGPSTLDALKELGLQPGLGARPKHGLEARLDVMGREGLAGVEEHARPQPELPAASVRVGAPVEGERRSGLPDNPMSAKPW
jgi:hypothetical protein